MSGERLAEIEKGFLEDDTVTDCGGCWDSRVLPEVLAIAKKQQSRICAFEAQAVCDEEIRRNLIAKTTICCQHVADVLEESEALRALTGGQANGGPGARDPAQVR